MLLMRGELIAASVVIHIAKKRNPKWARLMKTVQYCTEIGQMMILVNEAFEYACAQRATEFFAALPHDFSEPFVKLGFFPVKPDGHYPLVSEIMPMDPLLRLYHKYSPHYFRDEVPRTPNVIASEDEYSPAARRIKDRMARLRNDKGLETLQADFAVKVNAIRAEYQQAGVALDQWKTPLALMAYVASEIQLDEDFIWEVCPLEPRWVGGKHFDVLTDDWPDVMLWVAPPDSLAQAVMTRVVKEHLDGKDIIFVGREFNMDTKLDRTFVRALGIHKHVGTPILLPFRKQATRSLAVYCFLQPATITRIDIFKRKHRDTNGVVKAWSIGIQQVREERRGVRMNMAARMVWSGVSLENAARMANIFDLTMEGLLPYFQRISLASDLPIPVYC